jgi:hypothetical protein
LTSQLFTEMPRRVEKEPEGGSKNRKEVGNESPLGSIFQKQVEVPGRERYVSL